MTNKERLVWAGILLANTAWTYHRAKAADIQYDPSFHAIWLQGDIEKDDDVKFATVFDEKVPPDGKYVNVVLDSSGGDWDAGMVIGHYLNIKRGKGWQVNTTVPGGGKCVSSCISIFAASDRRSLHRGSGGQDDPWLGVHTVFSSNGSNDWENPRESLEWARALKQWHVPSRIITKLIVTSDRHATRLDDEDLKEWGIRWIVEEHNMARWEDGKPNSYVPATQE
jgi:hypothetical protein